MWEEKRNGKTIYRERLTDPVSGKTLNFSVTVKKDTAAGRKDARDRLYQKIARHKEVRMRLSDLVSLFVADQAATVKDSTRRRNQNTLERLVKILGDPYTDKLNAGYIRQKLIEAMKKPETRNEYLRRFRSMWRWAYRNNYVPTPAVANQLDNFTTQPHRVRIQDKYMEREQAIKVLAELPEDWSLVAEFMILSGLRFGELSALDRVDVTDILDIYKTRDAITGEISSTKTESSTRTVHVTAELRDLISRVDAFMDRRRELTGSECPALFLNDTGERINLPAFNKALKDATMKVLGRPLTSHALRHTFASLLMSDYVDISVITRTLGHQTSEITRRIYLHVTEELKKKDSTVLEASPILKKWEKNGNGGKNQTSASN